MREVYEFLKKCGTYFLATEESGQPRVRPFGTIDLFEDSLFVQTGKSKEVYRQLLNNPRAELCGCIGDDWLRVAATLVPDERFEAKKHMLDSYPELRSLYDPADQNTIVFRLCNASATFCSFNAPPRTVRF